ncbi:hypothetical protein PSTT_15163, partial [Puccinia striiformis]
DHRAPVVDSSSTYIQSTHSTGSSLTQDHSSRPITTTTTRNYPLNAELYETRLGYVTQEDHIEGGFTCCSRLFLFKHSYSSRFSYRAYCSAEILDLNLLPVVGPIAERWTKKNKNWIRTKYAHSSLLESINLSYTQSIYTESFNLIYLKINGTQLNYYHHVTECIYSKSIISINHSQSDNVSST